jgi:hypothetical protein
LSTLTDSIIDPDELYPSPVSEITLPSKSNHSILTELLITPLLNIISGVNVCSIYEYSKPISPFAS